MPRPCWGGSDLTSYTPQHRLAPDPAARKEADREVDMRTVRFNAPKARPAGMQIVTMNIPRGMLAEMDTIVGSEHCVPSRSELMRQFIREGLDRYEERAIRRQQLGLPP